MVLRWYMGPPKDDRTLLSGHPPPLADDQVPSSEPTTSDVERERAFAWVSRSEGPNFGETERFVEQKLLGVGGMSTVVRALDKDLHREVAIKVLSPDLSASESE